MCRLFKLVYQEFGVRILSRETPPLESVGLQKCLAFSTDGTKFAMGGEVCDHGLLLTLHHSKNVEIVVY